MPVSTLRKAAVWCPTRTVCNWLSMMFNISSKPRCMSLWSYSVMFKAYSGEEAICAT